MVGKGQALIQGCTHRHDGAVGSGCICPQRSSIYVLCLFPSLSLSLSFFLFWDEGKGLAIFGMLALFAHLTLSHFPFADRG